MYWLSRRRLTGRCPAVIHLSVLRAEKADAGACKVLPYPDLPDRRYGREIPVTLAPNNAKCTDFSGSSDARPHLAIELTPSSCGISGGVLSGASSGGTPGISGEGGSGNSGASGGISTGEAGGSSVGTLRGGTADMRLVGRISTKRAHVLSHCGRPNWNGTLLLCLKTLIFMILCRVSFISATMWNTTTIRPHQTR